MSKALIGAYVTSLSDVDLTDNVIFGELLRLGVKLLSITELELRREFGCSKPTVERWLSGESAPHPLGRAAVLEWLRKQAQSYLNGS